MLRPRVDLELAKLLAGEPVAGEHPLDRLADDLLGPLLEQIAEGAGADPARVAAVAPVELLLALVPGHGDLLGVDDDHEVADVDVRGVGRLVLAAQHVRDLGGQATEGLALGIDDVPDPLAVLGIRLVGLHRSRSSHKKSRAPPRPPDDSQLPRPGEPRSASRIAAVEGGRPAVSVSYQHVTKRYPGQDDAAIHDLSLEVDAGEICVLVGPSGSGKTSALRMVNRTVEITEGDILIGDTSVRERDPAELRREMGYVIQQIGLFPHRTVIQNIETVPRLLGWDHTRARERADELLDLIGLDPEPARPLPEPALGRPAAARRRGAGAGGRSPGDADGRALRGRSTRSTASACRTSSCGSRPRSARRSSSSPTTSTRRSRWATGSRSSRRAATSPSTRRRPSS